MEAILSSEYYTRYILPGLTFVVLFVFLPVLILKPDLLTEAGTGEAILVIVVALASGYLLDVAGAYGWLNRDYQRALLKYRVEVVKVAYPSNLLGDKEDIRAKSDVVLARFWARCPKEYQDLIEGPKAKWVLTLQAAFLCRFSSILWSIGILAQFAVYRAEVPLHLWRLLIEAVLVIVLLFLGRELSRRGLNLAKLADTTAITVLRDNRASLTTGYIPHLGE